MVYSRKFDAKKYWSNKPYCTICKKRKVVTGNICHVCQKEGGWNSKSVPNAQTTELQEEQLIKVFTSEEIDRSPAIDRIKGVAGYLKDCALSTLRSYNLTDITSTKDVSFLPLPEIPYDDFAREGILLSSEEAFNLAYKSAAKSKELDLLYGVFFIVGKETQKNDKTKKYLSPLLYLYVDVERLKEGVAFTISEDTVELNQGLLSKLVDSMQEDELEVRLQDIYQNLPSWPFTKEEVKDFVELVKNIFPNAFTIREDEFNEYQNVTELSLNQEITVVNTSAIILAPKKEAEGTVVNELLRLSTELLDNTAIDTLFGITPQEDIDEEYTDDFNNEEYVDDSWTDLNPLDFSETKKEIIQATRSNNLTVITGPPGTGKSYTIMGIILDHLLAGKRVLFVSKMDKAVDVVVGNLEKKVGPFSVARSGNRKAQRNLADKIEKITGPNSPVRKVTQDEVDQIREEYEMLENEINHLKKDFQRVVSNERNWGNIKTKLDSLREALSEISIRNGLSLDEDQAEKLKKQAQNAHVLVENQGFFLKTWWGKHSLTRIKNKLGLPKNTDIDKIITAIDSLHTESLISTVELELSKFEKANDLWTDIKILKEKTHQKAQELINSVILGNLYVILNNHSKRLQLRTLKTALLTANLQKKQELLSKVEADTLVTAFPFWASTTNHLSQILPLEPGIFDLVIFDEASQCDLASSLPALYRANRAVVVGDPQQLRHFVILSKQSEQAAMINNKLQSEDKLLYRFSERSLFDVAMDQVEQNNSFILDEHFRSDPRIISFSSKNFYDGRLRIMTNHPVKQLSQKAIEVRYIDGRRKESSAENPKEIKAIFEELREIINSSSAEEPTTIGVLCPFRDQVDAITSQLPNNITLEEMERHEIVVGTAHSLQGDEKDIILLSLSIDPDYHHGSLRFLEKPNVFNVSITRAKDKLIVFTSISLNDLPHGLLKDFLLYAETSLDDELSKDKYESNFEKEVAEALRSRGLQVWPQFEAAGFRIDLVVGNESNYIAVECDGPTHFDSVENAPYDDAWRQGILERAGWKFVRISYRDWDNNRDECLNRVEEQII